MKILITLFLSLFTFIAAAQDYYWVGGSGNWSDFANHWATTSGGATFHTSAPTSVNDVYFDAGSFSSSGQIITIDEEANCLSMDWTGATNYPTINSDDIDLNIYGSLILVSDMTADFSDVEFESTSSGNIITSSGVSLGATSTTRFNGIGGEWSLQDNFETNNLYVVAGTFTTNNHRIVSDTRFTTSGSDVKIINLGSSEVISDRWWIQGTNQTINAGTSTIVVSSFYGDTNGDGPFTYYDVVFDNYGTLRNTASFNKITVPAGITLGLESGSTFTVNEIEAEGNKHSFIEVEAETDGVDAIISQASGTVDWSYVELKDITAAGGATFTATNSIDNGNNTGWTINEYVGQDYFWVGNGGDWSDFENHWATTSGGGTMHSDYPNIFDAVYFDANSFTLEGQSVEQDVEGGTSLASMDWTGALNNPSLNSSYSQNFKVHGSAIFIDEMSRNLYGFDINGDEADLVLDMSGTGSITFLSIQGDGEYDILSDIDVASFTQRSGIVNYNGINIDCSTDFNLGHNELVANFGNATITCRDFTHNSSSSTISGTPTITVERNFEGNGIQFHEVILSGSGNVLGSNTLENLQIQQGVNTSFEAGETQTINQTLTLEGTKSSPISLTSSESGTQSSISVATGTIDAIYLTLQDIDATGGAIFNATQTLDNGNNTGWNITGLTSLDYYWVGDGGNWSDFANHWATTSGGATMHTDAPGVLDRVYFDANSFSLTDQSVLIDGGDISFHDMDWTGVTNNPAFSSDGNGMNVYGSMNFDASVSVSLNDVYFVSTEAETITINNDDPGTSAYFYFTGSGSWTFNSGFTVRELHQHSGDIDINGNKVVVDFRTDFFGENPKTMTLGASDFFTRSFSASSADNLTFDGSESSISCSSSVYIGAGSGNSFAFNDFAFTLYNSTDEGTFTADMTFNKLTFEPNTIIEMSAGITVTTNELVAVGTAEEPIAIKSLAEGNAATISQASGTVDAYYLELQDIIATGGATFNAFSSLNNGNVSGWTFNRLSQTITFEDINDVALDAEDFDLVATSSSELPVSFEIISGNVELVDDGSTVSILGGGEVQIRAKQEGNIDYDPAPSVTKTFTVTKLDQTIVFEELESKTVLDEDFELVATGGDSENEITFTSSNLDVATIVGSLVSIVGEGTTTITASQAGDDDYEAAESVDQVLTVTLELQEIVFEAIPAKTTIDSDFELNATGGASGNDITFSSSNVAVATVTGSLVSIVGEGTTTITASQAGNVDYEAAVDVEQELVVTLVPQVIIFEAIPDKLITDEDFNLEATGGSSGNDILFTSSNTAVATVVGTLVSIVGEGTTIITASQAGNEDYEPAVDVEQELVVTKILQVIVFEEIADRNIAEGDFELIASGGGSGNPIIFTSSDNSIASVDGNVVSMQKAGTVTISASQDGSNNYAAAESVDRVFTIFDTSQTIDFEALEAVKYGDANFQLDATSSSQLTVTYESSDDNVAQVTTSGAVTIIAIGTATITASQAGNADFDPADDVMQDLAVNPAILTVTAEDKSKIYGDSNPALTFVYGDFVNGEDETVLNTEPTVNTEADATADVGEHAITIQGGSADNYELERIEGVLEVTKRDLTAVADNQFMRVGDLVPELTISYIGLVNEDKGSEIDLPPAISTTASSVSAIGEYSITIAGGEDNNYLIVERVEGIMTVDRALGVDINALDGISFYPNPVIDFLNIVSDGKKRELEIRSLEGKLIGNYNLQLEKNIDLRGTSRGVYLLILKEGEKTIGTSRLIVE